MDRPRLELLSLPDELLHQVLLFVPFHALASVRRTCHKLHSLVSDTFFDAAHSRLKKNMWSEELAFTQTLNNVLNDNLLWRDSRNARRQAHHQLQHPAQLNCYTCLRNLKVEMFPRFQTRKKRSLGHNLATERACVSCMVRTEAFTLGSIYEMMNGEYAKLCWQCGVFKERVPVIVPCGEPCEGWFKTWPVSSEESGESEGSVRAIKCHRCWSTNHTITEAVIDAYEAKWCHTCYRDQVKEVIERARQAVAQPISEPAP
jgi:hypothetical protein